MDGIWKRLLTNQWSSPKSTESARYHEAAQSHDEGRLPDANESALEGQGRQEGLAERDSVAHHSTDKNDGQERDNIGEDSPRKLYVPLVLRRSVMLGFLSVFIALLAILIALYVDSDVDHGIDAAEDKNYYIWTYGPTAGYNP